MVAELKTGRKAGEPGGDNVTLDAGLRHRYWLDLLARCACMCGVGRWNGGGGC